MNDISTAILALTTCLTMLIGPTASAGGGMSEEQMQQMMKHAEEMQQCLGQVDQGAMKQLEAKSRKMQAEVKALCDAGKRDQAQSAAVQYGKDIANSGAMRELMKCGEMAKQMMGQMSIMSPEQLENTGHVCDNM